jgi:hypothetical protein
MDNWLLCVSGHVHELLVLGSLYSCESRILATLASPRVARHSLPMLTEGVWSEIRAGGECLRLFSEDCAEDCAQGVLASVYNVNGKTWIAPSEPVDNIQQGKVKK